MNPWEPYLKVALPRPTDADRARLERLAGASLPDLYWSLVSEHQGEVLDEELVELPEGGFPLGVLLLASPPDKLSKSHASYCVETCLLLMRPSYPAGLFPFADDTGGNYWAFDFRTNPGSPAVVFIDHEIEGEDGVTRKADSLGAFMALVGAPF